MVILLQYVKLLEITLYLYCRLTYSRLTCIENKPRLRVNGVAVNIDAGGSRARYGDIIRHEVQSL